MWAKLESGNKLQNMLVHNVNYISCGRSQLKLLGQIAQKGSEGACRCSE